MAFIGEINHGASLAPSMPSGLLTMVGQDGQHYVLANPLGATPIVLDHVEGVATVWTRTEAQWRTDLASLSMGDTGTAFISTEWGAPGTPYLYAAGYIDKGGYFEVVIVEYTIVDSSTVTVSDGFRYSTLGYTGVPDYVNAVAVIGTDCYIVCSTGGSLVNFNPTHKAHLVKLPLTGGGVDASSESWEGQITELPWEWGFLRAINGRPYFSRASIFEVEDGIRVDCYIGKTEVDGNGNGLSPTIAALSEPAVLSTIVSPGTHTTSGSTDVSDEYGVPFADTGLTFSGSPGTSRDDYTSPYLCADGKLRMGRGNSEDTTLGRIREFDLDTSGAGTVSPAAVNDYTLTDDPPALGQDIEFLQVFSEGSDLYWMIWSDEFYAFGILEDATEVDEPDDEDCGSEDEDDAAAPCLFEWDECLLVPESITVELVSPSVSPGRSLTGREQVIQPDAGCWRVTLSGIKVWSEDELLKWREYESALNGRTGTCCVPLYEGILSSTPIAATLGADAAIGVVRLTINQSAGATIRAGMHFQVGERSYRLISGSGTNWRVLPPLRDALTSGATLNFNDPRLRCRLERDDGMDIMLELLRFGKPSVTFIEDV